MFLKGTGQILTRKILCWTTQSISNWPNILKLDEKNVNLATNSFLDTVNSVLNKYASLKRVNKYNKRVNKINLGLLLVFKNQYILKTNY